MTSFEAGFVKYALEYGLSEPQAVHIMKRAAEYPGSRQIYGQSPNEVDQSPDQLDVLANLLKEELIHNQMSADRKKIRL